MVLFVIWVVVQGLWDIQNVGCYVIGVVSVVDLIVRFGFVFFDFFMYCYVVFEFELFGCGLKVYDDVDDQQDIEVIVILVYLFEFFLEFFDFWVVNYLCVDYVCCEFELFGKQLIGLV